MSQDAVNGKGVVFQQWFFLPCACILCIIYNLTFKSSHWDCSSLWKKLVLYIKICNASISLLVCKFDLILVNILTRFDVNDEQLHKKFVHYPMKSWKLILLQSSNAFIYLYCILMSTNLFSCYMLYNLIFALPKAFILQFGFEVLQSFSIDVPKVVYKCMSLDE